MVFAALKSHSGLYSLPSLTDSGTFDLVAQLVEHGTFNAGVTGSSLVGVTRLDIMCIWNVSEQDRHCSLCKLPNCNERIGNGKRNGKVMPTLMKLRINQSVVFSIDHYGAVRTAICYLKRDYDMKFTYCLSSDVKVTRVK